jgi:zinc protease
MELASVFEIVATAKPGHTGDELLKVIDEELDKLRKGGVEASELTRAKTTIESDNIFDLEKSSGRANRINNYNHYTGNPDWFAKDVGRIKNATAESVVAAAKGWIKEKDRVVAVVTPNKAAPIAGRVTNVKRGGGK